MEPKNEVLGGKFTKREVRIVERCASRQDQTVSAYIRSAVLTSCVLDGDIEAMKLIGARVLAEVAESGKRFLAEVTKEKANA